MAGYRVIRDVGESLVKYLYTAMSTDPQSSAIIDSEDKISQLSPKEIKDANADTTLSVYLYRVVENPFTKNQFPIGGAGSGSRLPPLSLDLNYMITPLMKEPADRQIVLGKVMQLLYDGALLEGANLVPPLSGLDEPVRLVLNSVPLEEITKVWQAMELDYKLSVCYVARVTFIDSERVKNVERVVRRTLNYGGA
ncbi:MAG TPA: DUF4255 domain-containing protein [Polyangiaceae bacterium]|nr:DUF4255 domain-containing protein [Polyangiaceae bacterium]